MKILTRADAARFLLEHDHFAILSHRRPDGDTVGSSAGANPRNDEMYLCALLGRVCDVTVFPPIA